MTLVFTPAQPRPPKRRACSIFTQRSITVSSPAARAYADGFVGNGQDVFGLAEAVDHVDLQALISQRLSRCGHACVAAFTQDFGRRRIHRHDAVAMRLHVLGSEET